MLDRKGVTISVGSSRVGFTGTRRGMTEAQDKTFSRLIWEMERFTEFHHGDCIGADNAATDIVAMNSNAAIFCHPPIDKTHRAFNQNHDGMLFPKTHFARNRDIVDETDCLIATPWQANQPEARTGGGTWYTIEYAIKRRKPVYVIWPDGGVEMLGAPVVAGGGSGAGEDVKGGTV